MAYCDGKQRAGWQPVRQKSAENGFVKHNENSMQTPVGVRISRWEGRDQGWAEEHSRLEPEMDLEDWSVAGRLRSETDVLPGVPVPAARNAVIRVKWYRDVAWSLKITVFRSNRNASSMLPEKTPAGRENAQSDPS